MDDGRNLGLRLPASVSEASARLRRFGWWTIITVGLWAVYSLWLAIMIFSDLRHTGGPALRYPSAFGDPSAIATANLMLSLWAAVGAAGVALMRANPFAWIGGKRIIWGSLALTLMLGRLSAGWLDLVLGTLPGLVVFWLAPPLLLVFGVFTMLLTFCTVGAFFSFFVGIPVMFFNQILQFENALHIYRHQKRGLVGYILRFGYWLAGQSPPNPPDDSKGARFATDEETVRLYNPDGMAFGHINDQPMRILTDKHVLIMASTRSGKGVTLIIPHLLRYKGSAFVLDPKGENAKATSRRRASLNDKVLVLDPFGITGLPQARFNPLARFTPENMEAESKALAAALFIVEAGERDHWNAAGQQLLAAVILYVYASPDIEPQNKDLTLVRRILLGQMDTVLQAMADSDLADGLVADLATSFLKSPEKEFGSVLSTAQRQTEILDNPYIIACLSAAGPGDAVDFGAWHRGTMTVYLCLSAPKFPVFNRWLRLVLTAALDTMTDRLEPPPLPVCFMLDELATLGHLPAVENAVGLAAGYGVQLVTVFQDVAQMRDLYKGRWASFIGNAGVRALFNLDDFDSAEYWSKFIGGQLVESVNRQQDIYGLSKAQSVGETMRPLFSPDEIMLAFGSDKMLVLPQGAHPIATDRVPYFRDGELQGLWDDPRKPAAAPRAASPPSPSAPSSGAAPPPPSPPPPVSPAPSASTGGIFGGLFGATAQSSATPATPPDSSWDTSASAWETSDDKAKAETLSVAPSAPPDEQEPVAVLVSMTEPDPPSAPTPKAKRKPAAAKPLSAPPSDRPPSTARSRKKPPDKPS